MSPVSRKCITPSVRNSRRTGCKKLRKDVSRRPLVQEEWSGIPTVIGTKGKSGDAAARVLS